MKNQIIVTSNWRVNAYENDLGELQVVVGTEDGAEVVLLPTDIEDAPGTLSVFFGTQKPTPTMYCYTSLNDDHALFIAYGKDIDGHTDSEAVIAERLAFHLSKCVERSGKIPTRGFVRNVLNASLISLNEMDRYRLREATIEHWVENYGFTYGGL